MVIALAGDGCFQMTENELATAVQYNAAVIVLVIDNENQTTKIVFADAKSLLEVTDNKDIFKLADKVDDLLKKAFNSISLFHAF